MASILPVKPSTTRAYGAGTIKRHRMTAGNVSSLTQQIYDVVRADHPQSCRHVFYRLTDPRLPVPVSKTEKGYRQVQQRLVEMRHMGLIPYDWISDTSRAGYGKYVTCWEMGGR